MSLLKNEYQLLKTLTEIDAISGYESELRNYLKEVYLSLGCELIFDNLGGVFAYKKSKNPNALNVMIDAHMDEVGFLSGVILDNGLISLLPIGGVTPKEINGAKLKLKTSTSIYKCELVLDEKENLYLDLELKNKEEVLKTGINYGDIITFDTEFKEISEDRYLAKAYDDRYGIALGIEILEYFKDKELPFNLYVGGSTQEEVGLRGARANLSTINPDLAIILDCSRASKDTNTLGHISEGVLIRYFDRAMVAFKELLDLQIKMCEESNSNYQYFYTMGGTNAGAIHQYDKGVLTLTHCVCAENIHTGNTIFSGSDYQNAKKSLIYLLDNFNNEVFNELRSKRR